MTATPPPPPAPPEESLIDLFSVADIQAMREAKRQKKAAEDLALRQVEIEQDKQKHELFLSRHLTTHAINLIMRRVHDAASEGLAEIMLGQFPSAWCTDAGRRINNAEEGWPETLPGVAREFFEFWERDLKPRGFHLRAEIITFPDGIPGDVGAYLSWPEDEAT